MRGAFSVRVLNRVGRLWAVVVMTTTFVIVSEPAFAADRDAVRLVEKAYSKMGGRAIVKSRKPLLVRSEGALDLTVRKQGRFTVRTELVPFHETLAVDFKKGVTSYDYHTSVNSDAEEWFRYYFDNSGRLLTVDYMNERAYWESGPGLEQQRTGYLRIIPHHLLSDALAHKDQLTSLDRQPFFDFDLKAVRYDLVDGPPLTLFFDDETSFLFAVQYELDLPARGDTQVTWVYEDFNRIEGGGLLPQRQKILLDGAVLKNMALIESGRRDAFDAAVATPPGILIPQAPPIVPAAAIEMPVSEDEKTQEKEPPAAEEEPGPAYGDIRPVREGVYVAINIRPGFHVLFIEFKDFVVAFEAPSGWYELQQMPAFNWSAGETSGSIARRYIERIHQTIPGKPIRYLVLTHHHSDHAGGLRPFVAEGATILATAATVEAMQTTLGGRYALEGSQDEILDHAPKFEIVADEKVISDGKRKLRLIDVGPNPHSSSMLVGYLPAEKLLYQSDLFEPIPFPYFPSKERVPVMKWFVDWLDTSKLKVEQVTAIHGTFFVTDEHLDAIRALE